MSIVNLAPDPSTAQGWDDQIFLLRRELATTLYRLSIGVCYYSTPQIQKFRKYRSLLEKSLSRAESIRLCFS